MTLKTHRNLDVAMQGEAFAAAKFRRFAAFARTRGNDPLADLLAQLADDGRMNHFAKEIQLAGTIADDTLNLHDAIREKLCHMERYRQFAEDAEMDGDLSVAFLFRTIIDDDQRQLVELEARRS
jgi:rubrerythrin